MRNNEKKKTIWFWIITILIISILVFVFLQFQKGSVTKWTVDKLYHTILEDQSYFEDFKDVKVFSNPLGYIIEGRYNDGDKIGKFTVNISKDQMSTNGELLRFISHYEVIFPTKSLLGSLISSLLPLVILILFYLWMFGAMSKGGTGGVGMFGTGKTKPRRATSPVKFSDVAGISEEKQELYEIVDYLKQPSKYAKHGARVPKGILMEGPPGTGKTLLAKAVAGEAGVSFFLMAGSEFEEMFVGLGASRVRDLFKEAKAAAPCIVFIDEIDAVGRKRNASFGSGTTEQTLNQLLVEMDGFEPNSGIIIMAATNRVDVLDNALLRPGRFDRTIQISLPDIREREEILKLHARNKKISPQVNWKNIAERTPGFSGAQLENVLNEAAILIVRNNKEVINVEDLDEAIDRVVGGPAKKSRTMTVKDKEIVSYHEAGHALIGLKLKSASKVQKVTIIPRGNAGGYTIMTPKDESNFSSKLDLYATITGYLGGRAAESIMFGQENITTGAHDDLDKATNIAKRMVTQFGMSSLGLTRLLTMHEESIGQLKGNYSDAVAAKIDEEVESILNKCYLEAIDIINNNKEELELIAESLRVLETITAEQIEYIDKNMQLPEEVIKEKQDRKEKEERIKKGEIIEIKPDDLDQ